MPVGATLDRPVASFAAAALVPRGVRQVVATLQCGRTVIKAAVLGSYRATLHTGVLLAPIVVN